MEKKRFVLCLLLLVFGVANAVSDNPERRLLSGYINRYSISNITMQDGLPHVFVDDVIKDSRGYIWISTQGGGVARYDGYEFIGFGASNTENGLKSNFVHYLCEDKFSRIWMSGDHGVDVVSVKTLEIEIPEVYNEEYKSFFYSPVSGMIASRAGNLWVSSRGFLHKVVMDDKGRISGIYKISSINTNERGSAMCEIDGYIWFQCGDMICRVQEETEQWQEPQAVSASLMSLSEASVFCISHINNDVWIGTSFGIKRYNLMTDAVKNYIYTKDNAGSLSQNYVTGITKASDGAIIVGTLMGINIYNYSEDNFEHIMHDDDSSLMQLNSDFVNVLYFDDANNIVWVGTETGGLTKLSPSQLYVKNYIHLSDNENSLSKNIVNAIVEDSDETLWVGVVEGGLNCKLRGENGFVHYNTEAPAYLSHNTISSLLLDDNERLYIGTWGGGAGWINRKAGESKRFHKINIDDMFVSTLIYDAINELVWIGTLHDVYVYDTKTGSVIKPFKDKEHDVVNIHALGGWVTSRGDLWLSSVFGLLRIDLHSYDNGIVEYEKFRVGPDFSKSGDIERITSVFEAKNGDLWIGSNGLGVYRGTCADGEADYKFTLYTTDNGLINNNVRGIQEDWFGNIWITTINGLSKYNVAEKAFSSYTSKDGIVSDHFYWNATAASCNKDKIYLGGVNGLSEVHPIIEKYEAKSCPLLINKVNVFDEVRYPQEKLEIHERDKSLSIEFAALDFTPPHTGLTAYSYRLTGFDDKWTNVETDRRVATYTNLRPGKYEFQLKYTSDGKNWISSSDNLYIDVKPYFYKTPWFILSVFVLVIFVAYRVMLWRFNEIKRQKVVLHQKVEERTRELQEQQKLLSKQTHELYNQNELLKEQNIQITEQKNKILEMSKKVEELTVDKLAFFTNITHEFRTPLTLIVGPIERALKLSYNPKVIEQLNLVEKNSKYLLSLVNQLLDFRKLEEGRTKIICHHGNIFTFIDGLLKPFMAFAEERGITMKFYARIRSPYIMFDEDIMRKVVTNLVSNALKFTGKEGMVSVYLALMGEGGDEKLYICVRDTGRGIPEEDVDRIFNRFYQSNNQDSVSVSGQSGTGIGLYLCKKLINLLGGNVTAKNNRTEGASFRIMLPVERNHEAPDDYVMEPEEHDEELQYTIEKNGKLSILIVEDNKDMRDYIRSILTEYYNVTEAQNGEEALEVLKSVNVDFVISDLMMPVMDGMELARRIRSDFSVSHIPILMLTAKTSDEARLESYKMGVDSYLLKPFDENLLLARISNILENRKRFHQKFYLTMDVNSLDICEKSGDKQFLDMAMKVVKENYKNPDFEVADFINEMGISKSLLNKKMQSITGQSANQFMRNYRLNIARELLLRNKVTRSMNISEIAYEVGFNDPKYFTRCFTKHFNVTPSSILEG